MSSVRGFAVTALFLCAGCTARPVSPLRSLPKDVPEVCAKHCDSIGMRLAAVVIIADSEGCVCEPREAPRAASREGAAAAGITPILAAAAAAAAQQQQLQRRQQQQQQGAGTSGWQPPPPAPPPPGR